MQSVPGPHCPTCATYEERVLAKAPGEALPPEVVPCKAFVMSDQFREWAVSAMRKEVMGQVSKSGLDRMAILKDGHVGKEPSNGTQSHQSKNK